MRIRTALTTATLVAVVGACSSGSATPSPDPNAAFCGSLTDVAVAVADYHRLGPEDSIEAHKAAARTVADEIEAAAEAGRDLRDAKVDLLASSVTTLEAYLDEVPQDIPVAQVQADIQSQLRIISAERLSLGVVVCGQPAPPSVAPAASTAPAASEAPASPVAS